MEGDVFEPPESDKQVNSPKDNVFVLHRPPHLGGNEGVYECLHVGGDLMVGRLSGQLGTPHRAVVVHGEIVIDLGVALGHEGNIFCSLFEAPGDFALFPPLGFGGVLAGTLVFRCDLCFD